MMGWHKMILWITRQFNFFGKIFVPWNEWLKKEAAVQSTIYSLRTNLYT